MGEGGGWGLGWCPHGRVLVSTPGKYFLFFPFSRMFYWSFIIDLILIPRRGSPLRGVGD
jgi:hypothetical protein